MQTHLRDSVALYNGSEEVLKRFWSAVICHLGLVIWGNAASLSDADTSTEILESRAISNLNIELLAVHMEYFTVGAVFRKLL